jgi:rare lipoprotein A
MRAAVFVLALALAGGAWADLPHKKPKVQIGKASIYAKKFANRKMANGRRMDPNENNAAHKTLPLGTRALVRNLETGKSAIVTIEDRGPHIPGRIVDLSPATAEEIGLERKRGLARVEVVPLEVPSE